MHHRLKALFIAAMILGVVLWLVGAGADGFADDDLRSLGVLVLLLTGSGFVAARAHVSDRLLEATRQHAYDQGYQDGCEVTRPALVRLVGGSERSPAPVLGASKKLS